ncbi:MAG TPA: aminoacyl-tRNA hydrolase, partial [Myxococcaceae bacterium]|nr:aminoacyl-tRNA hydrolase [Myxococcaceae bacterium]
SVAAALRFYKIAPEQLLVIHDELDLPFGRLQLKRGGGAGGHRGLSSLIDSLGTDDFARLRFGIGKPEGPDAKERVIGFVLSGFSPEERQALGDLIERAADAAEAWCGEGLAGAMNRFNRR